MVFYSPQETHEFVNIGPSTSFVDPNMEVGAALRPKECMVVTITIMVMISGSRHSPHRR